ncbi:MAG: GNAT family N-acetyltransferase [Anaerolineaceae bacterium]|jgi:CelD/BcsL family acetyltransferase involved in cellulose biosynthesis
MKLTLHRSFPNDLAPEWNALLEKTATHVPFMRYEYLKLWWDTRGGGEWPSAELALVTAQENGRLVAAAPLFYTPDWQGRPALLLVGSIEISDYLDLLAQPGDLAVFIQALLPFLKDAALPAWQALDLYNVLDDSPTLAALCQAADQMGWSCRSEKLQHSPYIPLPGDWEAYLAGIDKKQRHEIRRKLRRATDFPAPATWRIVSDHDGLDAHIADFMALMRMDADKNRFLTPAMAEHMRKTAHFAADNGILNLAFLEIGGVKAAGYFSFDFLNRLWVYNSGINWQDYSEYSPGWVLLAHLLRWANENGRQAIDFMRGDEAYKYRFGAVDRFVMRITIEKPTS